MIGEYYTAEVAAILGCSTGNVRNMVFREKIREVMKLNPRMSLVHSNEVERLRRNPLKVGRPRKKFPGQLDKDCDVVIQIPGVQFDGVRYSRAQKRSCSNPKSGRDKESPLLLYIEPPEVREQLKTGEWTVVLYHHDCPKCQQIVSDLASEGTPNVVCLEVPRTVMNMDCPSAYSFGKADRSAGAVHRNATGYYKLIIRPTMSHYSLIS